MTTTPRHILVLGGTSWLGGVVARLARDRGHAVTCLARGKAGSVPDGVHLVAADRWDDGAYDEVAGHDWDAVIEVSWQPELVRSALAALAERTRHWVYVSSISAYADHDRPGTDESAPVHEPWTGQGEAGEEDYGPAKVACEQACARSVPADSLLVARAGLIVGYGDRSDRFGYWPARLAQAAATDGVLAPPMDTRVQVVDVQDLAAWLLDAAEHQVSGTYDAVGDPFAFEELWKECVAVTGVDPVAAVASQEFLVEQAVAPWAGPESLPLWLPLPEYAGMTSHRNDAVKRAGLSLRPLRESVQASLAWERELGLGRERRAGLTHEREQDLVSRLRDTR